MKNNQKNSYTKIVYWVLILSIVLNLAISTMSIRNIRTVGLELAPIIYACIEIKVSLADGHLWFEETITGYENLEGYNETIRQLNKAKFYADAILNGGTDEVSEILPFSNEEGRTTTNKVLILLEEFEGLADLRFNNMNTNIRSDEELDAEFDKIYALLMENTSDVETLAHEDLNRAVRRSELMTIVTSFILLITMIGGIGLVIGSQKRVQIAESLNPLSGLPGNRVIEEEIRNSRKKKETSSVIYVDLDYFKSYNDKYGFKRGDEVLMDTGKILVEEVNKCTDNKGFVGHIGGDDFVLLVPEMVSEELSQNIIKSFDMMVLDHYRTGDIVDGKYISENRNGERVSIPVISISIAVVDLSDVIDLDYHAIIDICTDTKKKAKQFQGSVCYKYETEG